MIVLVKVSQSLPFFSDSMSGLFAPFLDFSYRMVSRRFPSLSRVGIMSWHLDLQHIHSM